MHAIQHALARPTSRASPIKHNSQWLSLFDSNLSSFPSEAMTQPDNLGSPLKVLGVGYLGTTVKPTYLSAAKVISALETVQFGIVN